VTRVIKNDAIKPKNVLLKEITDLYWQTDEDLSYERAIADGDWPSSVNILSKRLVNAISKITPETENQYYKMNNLSLELKEAISLYNQKEMLKKLES
jgi:hypothetical protein